MKLFLDSANLDDIKIGLQRGFLKGITTNPTLMAKEPKADYIAHLKKIALLCEEANQLLSLSVEVITDDVNQMVDQARQLVDRIDYENLYVKIPMGWQELEVIYQLSQAGIKTNCTCLFNEAQSVMAAQAGAHYVSIFHGRLKDIGGDPHQVIANTRRLLDLARSSSEIIVGSLRHARDVIDSQIAGGHIVTTNLAVYKSMSGHPQTDKSVQGFLNDIKGWLTPKEQLHENALL